MEWFPEQIGDRSEDDGTLPRGLVGRIAALALVLSSALLVLTSLLAPYVVSKAGVLIAGGVSLAAGIIAWWVPWNRMGRWSVLVMIPIAFVAVDLTYVFAARNAFTYSVAFVLIFALVGLGLPQWTAVRLAPLLVAAYVVPLVVLPGQLSDIGLGSAVFVLPVCILLGEAIAWGMHRYALAEQEIAVGVASVHLLFEQAPIGISKLGLDGRLLEVNQAYGKILGYAPSDLVGRLMRDFTHPDDQHENHALIARLLSGELDRFNFEKRCLHADGHIVWVSVNGSIARDPSGAPLFMIGQIEDITEARALRDQLALTAVTDPLTGLPNRMVFMEHLGRALEQAEAKGRHVALLFLDIDRFKLVNDGIGHDAGDRLLVQVGRRLQGAIRQGDFLARFGGDEFTLFCEVADEDDVVEIVGRLRRTMARPVTEVDFEQFVSLSIGIAVSTSQSMLPSMLLRGADIAMYQAKRTGPGRSMVFDHDHGDDAGRNLRTSNDLHRAIQESQLVLHYQPFVDIDRRRLIGTEALVRWQHPTRGLLPPSEFIDLAEECGMMGELGSWVLREACRQGAAWASNRDASEVRIEVPSMSVNISPKQLADPGFVDLVAMVLDETGFPAERLWLEITEGALLADPMVAIAMLGSIRELGVHLAIDDFGTGYSSLSYLKRMPVEALKIDRSFVEHIETAEEDQAIVESIVALGRALGIEVVAEGIEHPGQAIELAARGCRLAQGFLYGRPIDPIAIGPRLPRSISGWDASSHLTPV